jgi:hypothetical protein
MGQYSEGWITVPGKGKRWRDTEGNYSNLRPGFGSQTLGATGTAFLNMFRGKKERAFPDTFREDYDKDGSYVKPDRSGGFYGPGGNPSGSGMGQAQQSPGIGPYQGHTPGLPRPSQPADERTTTNANGVTQTMKAMSSTSTPIDMARSFDSLLEAQGNQPFGSNQLPTTAGSPDSNIGPVADGQEYANNVGRQGTKGVGPVADGQVYGNMLQGGRVKGDQNIGPVANGQEYAESLGKGGRLSDALNDKAGINSYMEKFSGGDKQRAASMAFLNAEDSLSGLQARDAVNDVVYAGGQHYGRGALSENSGLGDKYKLDRADARDIASGKSTAAGLLETYKNRITSAQQDTPAQAQDPKAAFNTESNLGVSNPGADAFNLDKGDFKLNNEDSGNFIDTTIDIGNKKGKGFPSTFGGF